MATVQSLSIVQSLGISSQRLEQLLAARPQLARLTLGDLLVSEKKPQSPPTSKPVVHSAISPNKKIVDNSIVEILKSQQELKFGAIAFNLNQMKFDFSLTPDLIRESLKRLENSGTIVLDKKSSSYYLS